MKVIFAGGGTGGHINPAISVADYLKSVYPDMEALFIGTKKGLETKLVPAAGYDIEYIDICGFDRKNPFNNIKVMKKLFDANRDCVRIIKEFGADAVVCTGGYVSGPVCIAAKKCGVPAIIHEQNVYPGLTVKGSGKYVDYIAVSFEETIKHLKMQNKCVVTGNPVRESILKAKREECRSKLGLDEEDKFVLVFGGSLGAYKINEAMIGVIKKLEDESIKILFGTGERNYKVVMNELKNLPQNVTVTPYINNMHEVMAACDVAVTRSGAITVSELACLNKPAILIPSPNVVRNHQEQNAAEFENGGAAVMIREAELTSDKLLNTITELCKDSEKLDSMSRNMEAFAKRDALEKIGELVKKMVNK